MGPPAFAIDGTAIGGAADHSCEVAGGQSTTNLSVIAGVVIGGTSLFGGYGSIFGSVIGLFIPATLQDGFVIIGTQPFWQQVVGAVLIAAVYVDQQRRAAALRGGGRPKMSSLLNRLVTGGQVLQHGSRCV